MKKVNQVWVSPYHNKQWKIHSAGSERAAAIVNDKQSAYDTGRTMAINKKAELVVQNKNGHIGIKNSYGNDPAKTKG